ncbi:hypothetical protein K488DRAFT_88984 [Vararia minispora EC-137]|uniref:Uncharacterized protein n=1 Tax=Vararia minispora EC-137 TaxID=1314806 RepID=A0ACB8QBG5_9AGAM|nr:hypothetical protein K488DRAFT_88984 [Vararia minispora EC-137]
MDKAMEERMRSLGALAATSMIRQTSDILHEKGMFTVDRFFKLAMGEQGLPDDMEETNFCLNWVQRMPMAKSDPIWHELAAKHLPELVEKWRTETLGLITPVSTTINTISYTPYFVRFIKSPAGQGMAALQAKRAADAAKMLRSASENDVAQVFQFLSTLLLLQTDVQFGNDVDPEIVQRLLPLLRFLNRKPEFANRLASEASERVLCVLSDRARDQQMRPLLPMVKATLETPLKTCGVRNCRSTAQGKELMKCSRCKTAVYCSTEHQRWSWPDHKKLCFAATF